MSLQAKIEAVIYASEEPVTLPQLMGLLGEEAQTELDALDSQQTSLALDGPEFLEDAHDEAAGEASGDQDALNAELLDNPELSEEAGGAEQEAGSSEESGGGESPTANGKEPVAAETAGEADDSTAAEDATQPADDAVAGSPAAADDKAQAREAAAAAKTRDRRLREYFRSLLDRLIAEYAHSDRGLEIREVAGGFRMATKPEYHDAVRGFVKSLKPPLKLSLQALETLAVIAYKQPVTAPEISEIRGVESAGVLGTLMARKLIGTAGRKAVIGRPMLYKTTKEFLLRFGLKDINELPSIEEFEKLASELNEPVQEEIPMDETAPEGELVDLVSGDGSPVLDERNTPPAKETVVHESAEEMMTDQYRMNEVAEPASGVSAAAARDVESMADVHEPQADGDSTPTAEAQENPGYDAIVDGRISGLPPKAGADEVDNPSAQEAAEQAAAGEGD